jgi:hypothetical protein
MVLTGWDCQDHQIEWRYCSKTSNANSRYYANVPDEFSDTPQVQNLEPPASKSVGPATSHVTGYGEEASFSDLAF